jgi:hypothetical protein
MTKERAPRERDVVEVLASSAVEEDEEARRCRVACRRALRYEAAFAQGLRVDD